MTNTISLPDDMLQTVISQPTANLRFRRGTLQQAWQNRTASKQWLVWKDVPTVADDAPEVDQ